MWATGFAMARLPFAPEEEIHSLVSTNARGVHGHCVSKSIIATYVDRRARHKITFWPIQCAHTASESPVAPASLLE